LYLLWFDRHAIWKSSKEAVELQKELDEIHAKGRNLPAIETTVHGEFATSWFNQLRQLLHRAARANWRNPTYLIAKLVLNSFGGLFIGVSLYLLYNQLMTTLILSTVHFFQGG
jgi:ATP-binding cassette subfamily G (WHITE) protein 2 (SNQ2)